MPRENDPGTGRFGRQRPLTELGQLDGSGYEAIVLERLAKHACRIAGVDRSAIFVRDRRDPRVVIAAAGHGLSWDFVGSRVAADEGFLGDALADGESMATADTGAIGPVLGAEDGARSAAAAPIRNDAIVIGVVCVLSDEPGHAFDDVDLELLEELGHVAAAAIEREERRDHFDKTVRAHVDALAAAMDMRDRRTARHSEDVVALAREVGELLELEAAALIELEFAARLHDVGKIRVPDAVLNKPGPLDADESKLIQNHSAWGAETLEQIPGLEVVSTLVRFHHERWDGRGYPDGLAGPRIPLASRIIAVCDSYGAMTCDRPYRRAMAPREALAELRRGSGKQFDPMVVEALLGVIERTPQGMEAPECSS
jgi:GAF domain-containing protein